MDKYPKNRSLDTTGVEEDEIVVISHTSLPAERQYLGELKKESASLH